MTHRQVPPQCAGFSRRTALATIGAFSWGGSARADDRIAVGLVCLALEDPRRKAKHFWLNFAIEDGTWAQGEPYSTSDVFISKRGRFKASSGSVSLLADDGRVVGEITRFDLQAVKEDDEGAMGQAVELGRSFSWKIAIVMR